MLMNINGLARGLMSSRKSGEEFYLHVVNCIEQQLKEWNEDYEEAIVMKLGNADYQLMIRNKEQVYCVALSQQEIESLQKSSPYALDHILWRDLEKQGLPIIRGFGNYIDAVL